MASLKERLQTRVAEVRERRPLVDHLVRMQEHYGEVKAGQQAGAVTYFGFLSFFPILALSFFVVGYVSQVYPDARENLTEAIDAVLPGLIGTGESQVQLADIEAAAGAVGLVGLAGVLYSGLGWLSALRDALITVFELPAFEQPSFVLGKVRDLITLVVIGVVLMLAVGVTGFVSGFSQDVLGWLGLGAELGWLVTVLTIVLGLAANMVLFFAMFRLLAAPDVPQRSLWSGALLGAVGFEVLKQLSGLLLRSTEGQPAFQAFGIALILLVWINYFSRVVLYAAAWAWTTAAARAARPRTEPPPVQGPPLPSLEDLPAGRPGPSHHKAAFAAGAASAVAAVAVLRRKERTR
ncbi:YihY/virulence factor BrkB family protein [Nocardioides sp. SYSU D00038]|uniref:YihY/virulence factor BrkB family protein n=1 Tax=Nocardioides sp. SYSU D00038 TaxID=2812554 RepID=UPI0019680AD0|nr:YihY/virulence factor BrkB family protein [Nocardioides sp. SYSU D00038]